MRKINQIDSQMGKTVFSFSCPCSSGICTCSKCSCDYTIAAATALRRPSYSWNRVNGGSTNASVYAAR